jgi:hypothetical protein
MARRRWCDTLVLKCLKKKIARICVLWRWIWVHEQEEEEEDMGGGSTPAKKERKESLQHQVYIQSNVVAICDLTSTWTDFTWLALPIHHLQSRLLPTTKLWPESRLFWVNFLMPSIYLSGKSSTPWGDGSLVWPILQPSGLKKQRSWVH